ncbi:MAG: ABC transporter ATP-binding protein [Acidimicrobiales bacterium]
MTLLSLEGVEKRFGGLPAVNGVNLKVGEGEILALVGPNGAGKSTLLKAISGLQPPSQGVISFLGENIAGLKANEARKRGISMVLQTPRTFESMTVRDNVAVGARFGSVGGRPSASVIAERVTEALGFVGLADLGAQSVGTLNLHQQRFLELARSLAGRPKLLLLDEVMAGLNDTELQASIDIVLMARDQLGITVIWVEHVMKAVMKLAERVVVLDFGKILADGAPDDVMRNPAVVTAYLGSEMASHGG